MDEEYKVWCGNLPSEITEELLFELFLQAGPLSRVIIPKDKNYSFITYKHTVSVAYAVGLLNGTKVFGKNLIVKTKGVQQQPERVQQPEQNHDFRINDFNYLESMGSQMMHDNGYGRNNRTYVEYSNSDRNYRNGGRDERRNDTRPYHKHDDREQQNYNNHRENRNRRHNRNNYSNNYNQQEQSEYSEGNYGSNRNNRRRY